MTIWSSASRLICAGGSEGIEALLDRDAARKPGKRETAGMAEQWIDILAGERQWPCVAEVLHPVDQRGDAVDLGHDQRGEFARTEQLRCTADARQRVLDLVRQHRGRTNCRPCSGRTIGRVTQSARGGRAVQRDRPPAGIVGNLRLGEIDADLHAARGRYLGVVHREAMAVPVTWIFGRRDDRIERLADHQPLGQVQQLLGERIGVRDTVVGIDDDDRDRKSRKQLRKAWPTA